MIYLIGQSPWLLLVAAFAALAGWALAARRAAPAETALRRNREKLVRDIVALSAGSHGGAPIEAEREIDSVRRAVELRDGRIVGLEQALANARARADDAVSQAAELKRRLDHADAAARQNAGARLEQAAEALVVETQPANEEETALQAWRLRYFEQRVRYLESHAREAQIALAAEPAEPPPPPVAEWRAREAEARAAHLEDELRVLSARQLAAPEGAADPVSPFAANAEVDALLRWRLLYLERRVAHLQAQAAQAAAAGPAPAVAAEPSPDMDRWKWRSRYLEARVRHLEQRPVQSMASAPMLAREAWSPEARPAPRADAVKPPVLAAARNGVPDDFTLIEAVSALQQTTLYAIGVFHFDQIAAWAPAHVVWVDQYLRLRGRIDEEEWIEQARSLAQGGVAASRRRLGDEEA